MPSKAKTSSENNKGTVFIPALKENGDSKGKFDAVYENAIYTQLKSNGGNAVVRARGRAIGRAVNIVAKTENRGFCKIKQDSTEIFTEKMGDGRFCSAIKIEMAEN